MTLDLLTEVQTGLRARKGQWKQIADEVEGVSYSWIAQVGRGKYESEPAYSRLQAVAAWLRENPTPHQQEGARA
jgi:hypothetical protein